MNFVLSLPFICLVVIDIKGGAPYKLLLNNNSQTIHSNYVHAMRKYIYKTRIHDHNYFRTK